MAKKKTRRYTKAERRKGPRMWSKGATDAEVLRELRKTRPETTLEAVKTMRRRAGYPLHLVKRIRNGQMPLKPEKRTKWGTYLEALVIERANGDRHELLAEVQKTRPWCTMRQLNSYMGGLRKKGLIKDKPYEPFGPKPRLNGKPPQSPPPPTSPLRMFQENPPPPPFPPPYPSPPLHPPIMPPSRTPVVENSFTAFEDGTGKFVVTGPLEGGMGRVHIVCDGPLTLITPVHEAVNRIVTKSGE